MASAVVYAMNRGASAGAEAPRPAGRGSARMEQARFIFEDDAAGQPAPAPDGGEELRRAVVRRLARFAEPASAPALRPAVEPAAPGVVECRRASGNLERKGAYVVLENPEVLAFRRVDCNRIACVHSILTVYQPV